MTSSTNVSQHDQALPACLVALFQAATSAETTARNSERRRAYASTRLLIGGAHHLGYSYDTIATVFDVTPSSTRNRNGGNRPLPVTTFARLTGVSADAITGWHDAGLLPHATVDDHDETSYLPSDLITALTHT